MISFVQFKPKLSCDHWEHGADLSTFVKHLSIEV